MTSVTTCDPAKTTSRSLHHRNGVTSLLAAPFSTFVPQNTEVYSETTNKNKSKMKETRQESSFTRDLSKIEIAEFREAFDMFDIDGGGKDINIVLCAIIISLSSVT